MSPSSLNNLSVSKNLRVSMPVSKRCDLQDILSRSPIPNDFGILLKAPLTIKDAKELAHALTILATKIDVSQLSLALRCKCSRETSSIVAEGLHHLRGLKDIALVLNSKPGPASAFARTVVRSLQDSQEINNAVSISLTTLPREIRHSIIDYVLNAGYNQELFIHDETYDRKLLCCRQCMPADAISRGYCACQRLVGGHSTTCVCDRKRTALFWTNKMLFAESTYVLLSTNRIRLLALMPASKFFSNLSDDSLHVIKTIELYIAHGDYTRQTLEFKKITSIIKEKCNLPKLWLSINFVEGGIRLSDWETPRWDLVKQMRESITDALRSLKGLGRLDIYLSANSPEEEDKMEKSVMGEEYDAIALGKIHTSVRDLHNVYEYAEEDDGVMPWDYIWNFFPLPDDWESADEYSESDSDLEMSE